MRQNQGFITHQLSWPHDLSIIFYWNKRELQGLFEKISSKFLTFRVWKHQFFMKLFFQRSLKIFLEVVRRPPRYLEAPPTSGLYNTPTPMVIRPTNQFLFKKKVNSPQLLAVFFSFLHKVSSFFAPAPWNLFHVINPLNSLIAYPCWSSCFSCTIEFQRIGTSHWPCWTS